MQAADWQMDWKMIFANLFASHDEYLHIPNYSIRMIKLCSWVLPATNPNPKPRLPFHFSHFSALQIAERERQGVDGKIQTVDDQESFNMAFFPFPPKRIISAKIPTIHDHHRCSLQHGGCTTELHVSVVLPDGSRYQMPLLVNNVGEV